MQPRLRSLLTVAVVTLGALPLAAQSAASHRHGFFIGFGLGGGGGTVENDDNADGGMGWLTLGGTISPRLRLAADFEGMTPKGDNADYTLGTSTFAALYYPSVTSNFFMKAGIGAATVAYTGPGPNGNGTGLGGVFGAGFDMMVGQKVSITPQLTFFGGSTGDIRADDNTFVANDVHFSMATLSIGVVFH